MPDPEREVNTNLALISLEPVADDVRRRLGLRAGTDELLGKLSAQIDRNSNVVSITVRDASAQEAAGSPTRSPWPSATSPRARRGRASTRPVAAARERAAQLPVGPDRDALEAEIRRLEAAGAFATGGVQVVRRATAASASRHGGVAATGLVAGFLGVLLAAVTMVVLARTDRSVSDEEEIEALLELPVLATVPPVPGPSTDTAAVTLSRASR